MFVVALEELHSMNIAHMDIYTRNILLDNDGHIVLIDYGISYINDQEEIFQNAYSKYRYKGFKFVDALNIDFALIGNF